MVVEANEMQFTVWTVIECTIIPNKHNILQTYIQAYITVSSILIPNVG